MASGGRPSLSRRGFLTGFSARNAALAATGGLLAAHVARQEASAAYTLRPPGAQSESDFLATCLKCGQCVTACPFYALRLAKSGEAHVLGTPYFEPREIACQMCEGVPCARACPSGALDAEVAIKDARMGIAVLVDQENCLAYLGLRCEACYRACPMSGEAIQLEFQSQERTAKHAFFLPKVRGATCTGCGRCENACVMDSPAIRVLPREIAVARGAESYRIGWREDTVITGDFPAAQQAPAVDNLDAVLQSMGDTRAIEDNP